MSKHAVHHIIDTLTPDAICADLGVSSHMIRHARTTGVFPSSWYDRIFEMCSAIGIPCPRSAFNWKRSANKVGSAIVEFQGDTAQKANGGVA